MVFRQRKLKIFAYGDRGTSPSVRFRSGDVFGGFASAARLAAHRAFIAAASCARRSGERLSFLFAFLAFRLFVPAGFVGGCVVKPPSFFWVGAEDLAVRRASRARAADFVTASSFRFSLASFFGPSCRRASSRRIFFLRVLSFIMRSTVLRLTQLVDLVRLSTTPVRLGPILDLLRYLL